MQTKFSVDRTAIHQFVVTQVAGRRLSLRVGNSLLEVDLKDAPLGALVEKLAARNIVTVEQLAERALRGIDPDAEAKAFGITPLQAGVLYQCAVDTLDPATRRGLEQAVAHPKGRGGLDVRDPLFIRALKVTPRLSPELLSRWRVDPRHRIFIPLGPTKAVDHRPSLGLARDQGGRFTCTAFGATAVMEALEYLRDRRPGPRDLSEELLFWYSKGGQLYTAGGYNCAAALRHYTEYGSSEEIYFPYDTSEIPINCAQVPAPDDAMDRAHFFTSDAIVGLPNNGDAGDISACKEALRSGRCVGIHIDPDNWDTGAGMIGFPDPLDSKGRGGSHCTAIIGFIDRDDLPSVCEGGYFIVRNSWDGAGSTSNLLGPEYGGHLLMPYGWYRRYVSSATTFVDGEAALADGRKWRTEYYPNPTLRGLPALAGESDKVDFDWGTHGPFTVNFPLPAPFPPIPIDLGPVDLFSARFTQIRRFRPGWWRFRLRGDDGVRLWVDDRLVINSWKDQSATEYVEEHYLSGGDHLLRVEYYEHAGVASVLLQVEPVNLHYDLFANANLSGAPAATYDDTMTDPEWRQAPPVSAAGSNGVFSLRARATKRFAGGSYRFHARHTGGCCIYIDGGLVLDDWNGTSPDGAPVAVADGDRQVVVEFKNLAQLPAPGVHGYYRAALDFGWSEETWQISIHKDLDRKTVKNNNFPNPDSPYEAFRTDALTGAPVFEYRYPANNNVSNQYLAQDGIPLMLHFRDLEQFKTGIPGGGAIPDSPDHDWLSAHIRRRIFISQAGTYQIAFSTDDGHRLIVDGKQRIGSVHIVDDRGWRQQDLELEVGVHDIAIEYANTEWNGYVFFTLDRAAWTVDYYRGVNFDSLVATQNVDSVGRILDAAPSPLGGINLSLRARRSTFLPVGRYRVQVRADDGVRLKVAGVPLIDAWTDQGPTSYWAFVEHRGGDLPIEIEYYQRYGGELLEFDLVPAGFFGEYYRGVTLEKPGPGATLDRNVPIAYRYEPAINFDWGRTGRLPRIGAELFSARWSGPVMLPVGRWKISVASDDGVRLFIDGRMLIDDWQDQASTESTAILDLTGRAYDFVIEYYQRRGEASCRLAFERLY